MKPTFFIWSALCWVVLVACGTSPDASAQSSPATNGAWVPVIMHPVKDAGTVEMLRAALKEPDPVVRERALEALAIIRDGTAGQGVRPVAPAGAVSLAEAMRGSNTVALVRALRSLDGEAARQESKVLIGLLRRPEVVVQEEAVRAIHRGRVAAAGSELITRLNEPDEGLRLAASEALAAMFDQVLRPELMAGMVQRLEVDPSSQVRRVAGLALVALQDTPARDALLRLLKHERGVTRASAAAALGAWGDPELAGTLHPLLADPADLVARNAAHALGQLRNPASKQPLIAAFKTRSSVVLERAAWALGELKSTEAVLTLIGQLGTTDEAFKVALIIALGKTGDKQALPPLRQVLQNIVLTNNLPKAREAAFIVLTDARDKVAIPRAVQMVTTPVVPPVPGAGPTFDEDFVRIAALHYLSTVGDRTIGTALLAKDQWYAPRGLRAELAATLSKLLGQAYRPVADEDYRRYFVETITPRAPTALPPLGVVRGP
ncbi:MAG: HEAT repeat domain-containing protein [Proteobacteria bacterium]|nr:HEAT repeat domain-containing protein [Pseudomonadota bacterium]